MELNSHKDFVKLLPVFKEKMLDFVSEVVYAKSNDDVVDIFSSIERRGIIVAPTAFEIGNEDGRYNHSVTYSIIIVDTSTKNEEAILESEEDNFFVMTAFHDFLNYVKEGSVEFIQGDIEKFDGDLGTTTSISCQIVLHLKSSPTFWTELDDDSSI